MSLSYFKYHNITKSMSITVKKLTYFFDIDDYDSLAYNGETVNITWNVCKDELFLFLNGNLIHILEKIFSIPYDLYDWIYIDNNKYNIKRDNITYTQKCNIILPIELTIIKKYDGIIITTNFIHKIKNIYWLIDDNNVKYYILTCGDNLIKIDYQYIDIVLNTYEKHIWVCYKNIIFDKNYAHVKVLQSNGKLIYSTVFMHKLLFSIAHNIILDSLDDINIIHDNSDIYDNRISNLRLECIKTIKKEKNIIPKDFFINNVLPKYLVYYNEKYGESEEEKKLENKKDKKDFIEFRKNKIKNNETFIDTRKSRNFFIIENHPKLEKVWVSIKSNGSSIKYKYEEALKKLEELNNIL
jgi:hypothetical protein